LQILKLNFFRKELRKEHHILHVLFCFFLYESQKFTNQRFWTRNFRFLIPTKLETIPPSRPSRLDWLAPVHVFFFCWKKGLNMVMVEVGKTSTVYAHFVRLLGVE
jgi:hypothetical protein